MRILCVSESLRTSMEGQPNWTQAEYDAWECAAEALDLLQAHDDRPTQDRTKSTQHDSIQEVCGHEAIAEALE